jgi:hypothetical protein
MRWSDCSPVLLALASKRRTCWFMRSCRGVCGIDELWRATLVSPARQMRAAADGKRKDFAKAGNARVRRGMIQLAWRLLLFQKDSALAQWYCTRTESAGKKRKTMIVALARKLLIALWRLVTIGEVPAGVVLRAA